MHKKEESLQLVENIVKNIQDKKGKEIVVLDMESVESSICDYFIVCHGDSTRQVDAIAKFVEKELQETAGIKSYHSEGYENASWILLDYIDVVVHIFHKETREFYNLEALWADARQIDSVFA